jgi:hypothetical protein
MASDNLNEVGRYLRRAGKTADQALKRTRPRIPVKDRVRDSVSSAVPFSMSFESNGNNRVIVDINFNKPPPSDCGSGCFSTSCEKFNLNPGGHSLTVTNPYEPGSTIVYSNGTLLSNVQWFEENPLAGQVYVQVQAVLALIVICYSYVTC